jgi:hypothetical protein
VIVRLIGPNAVVDANSVVAGAVWADAQVGPRCEIQPSWVAAPGCRNGLGGRDGRQFVDRSQVSLFWSGGGKEQRRRGPSRAAAGCDCPGRPVAGGAAWPFWRPSGALAHAG